MIQLLEPKEHRENPGVIAPKAINVCHHSYEQVSSVALSVLVVATFVLYLGSTYSLIDWLRDGSILGLGSALSAWVFQIFVFRLPGQQVSASPQHPSSQGRISTWVSTIAPQHIWQAAIALGVGIGLSFGLSNGLYFGLPDGLSYGLRDGLSIAWILAISGFLLMWTMSGGLTVLRHYSIRWLLARSQTFPWRAQAFLDDATARILLQRVGGGYRFMHRLLLDYFADLDQTGAPADPAAPSVANIALTPPENPSA